MEKRSSYRIEDQSGCFVCRDCGQLKDLDGWYFVLNNKDRICKKCFDSYDIVDNYGNLASQSYEFGEIITKDVANNFDLYVPSCHVESCENCEILYKRIPKLVESYE